MCERLVIILLAEKHSFVGGNVFFFFFYFFFAVERLPPAFIIIKSFIYLLIFLSMYTHVECWWKFMESSQLLSVIKDSAFPTFSVVFSSDDFRQQQKVLHRLLNIDFSHFLSGARRSFSELRSDFHTLLYQCVCILGPLKT